MPVVGGARQEQEYLGYLVLFGSCFVLEERGV